MTTAGNALVLMAVLLPLAMAVAVPLVARPLRMLPWAALPGLAAAVLAPHDVPLSLPTLLPHAVLVLDAPGAVFLGCGSLLWLVAGAFACAHLDPGDSHGRGFAGAWLLALAGTSGAFVAADAVTFYAAFSAMSLSAWLLVIHRRNAEARYAGRVYIALAVFGEATLLAALSLAAAGADSLSLVSLRDAVAGSASRDWIVAGLLIGFGIKAGLVPLHVWLPLAHPQAPVPASAVLSGVIVKLGLFGLYRLLPLDAGLSSWGQLLSGLGIASVVVAAVVGLRQTRAKRVLAYSTVSQAGLVAIVLGAAAATPDAAHTISVAMRYAAYEGLGKGAMFIAVALVAWPDARVRRAVFALTAVLALAAAGLPLSGGAVGKHALKQALGDSALVWPVVLSSLTTALLMLHFLRVLRRTSTDVALSGPAVSRWLPWAALAAVALALPWLPAATVPGVQAAEMVAPWTLWQGTWPIAVALLLTLVWRISGASSAMPWRVPGGPPTRVRAAWVAPFGQPWRREASVGGAAAALDRALGRWSCSGPMLLVVAGLIGVVLLLR